MSEEAKQERGIKEISEVLDFVEHLSLKGIEAAKDGLGLEDIPALLDPSLFSKASDAFKGLGEVDDELKDLSSDEVKALAGRLIDIGMGVLEAVKEAGAEEEAAEESADETA